MEKKTARLEAFSDGIFGVAITLLAIEIGIKEYAGASNAGLWQRIVSGRAEYFAYFNSFATVLLIWMGHHKIFDRIWKAGHRITLLNGLVLLLVALFPFPTRMVGAFIETEAVSTAVSFYAAFTGLIVLSMLLLNLAIVNKPSAMVRPEKNIPWFRNQIRQQAVAILVYAVAAVVAFYFPVVALSITFAMWVFWAFVTKDSDQNE